MPKVPIRVDHFRAPKCCLQSAGGKFTIVRMVWPLRGMLKTGYRKWVAKSPESYACRRPQLIMPASPRRGTPQSPKKALLLFCLPENGRSGPPKWHPKWSRTRIRTCPVREGGPHNYRKSSRRVLPSLKRPLRGSAGERVSFRFVSAVSL